MRRLQLPLTFTFLLGLLGNCEKPATEETTPPGDDSATADPGTTEPAADQPDPEAEKRAAEEAAAAAAAKKKADLDAQIAMGKDLYGANCASCHGDNGEGKKKNPKVVGEGALPLDAPKGAKLRKGIQFNTAKDVADFVVANMPLKKGGTLKPEEYYAILGFDLSANGIALAEPVTAENAAGIQLRAAAATPPAATATAPAPAPAPK